MIPTELPVKRSWSSAPRSLLPRFHRPALAEGSAPGAPAGAPAPRPAAGGGPPTIPMVVLTGRVRLAAIFLLTVPGLEAYDHVRSGASCAAAGCATLDSSQCSSEATYQFSIDRSDRPPDCHRKSGSGKLYFNTNTNPSGCTTSREC
eukprot:scaffold43977_cov55-Phaeocystis_antarctica.AAC.1